MKLYRFNPNTWDVSFFVVEESLEKAIIAFNKNLETSEYKFEDSKKWGDPYFKDYSIEVYEIGQIVEVEIN